MAEPISVLVWGHPKTRKTTLALTFPGPVHVFDFDQGIRELTAPCSEDHGYPWWRDPMECRLFNDPDEGPKHITLHPMVFASLDPDLAEYKQLLTRYQSRYEDMLRGKIPCGTVVVDTDSQWVKLAQPVKLAQALEAAQRRGAKRSEPSRLDYGVYNQYRESTIQVAKANGVNLVLIERAQEIWGTDEDGRSPAGTGRYRPKGSADTGALVHMTIRMEKQQVAVEGRSPVVLYSGVVEDSRFPGAGRPIEGQSIRDITYRKLVKALFGE